MDMECKELRAAKAILRKKNGLEDIHHLISRQCKAEIIKRVWSEEDVYIGQWDKVKRSEVDPCSQLISDTYQAIQ